VVPALIRLTVTLADKGILTGKQPWDIFNNATAAHT
jgi:hypothetical protein